MTAKGLKLQNDSWESFRQDKKDLHQGRKSWRLRQERPQKKMEGFPTYRRIRECQTKLFMPLTYLLFLARPLGLYSSHASKLGSQQRGWENTLNYSLYYAPKMSTTPVSLVLPFLQFFGCFLQGAVILGPRQYNTALVFELSEKELLRLKAAVENTPAQGRTG